MQHSAGDKFEIVKESSLRILTKDKQSLQTASLQ